MTRASSSGEKCLAEGDQYPISAAGFRETANDLQVPINKMAAGNGTLSQRKCASQFPAEQLEVVPGKT